jgi:hypothetical protein
MRQSEKSAADRRKSSSADARPSAPGDVLIDARVEDGALPPGVFAAHRRKDFSADCRTGPAASVSAM